MSKLETNTIDTVSGTSTLQVGSTNTTTITLGASGDTINIPSGATIANSGTATGFGGITMADQWRLTTTITSTGLSSGVLASNLERNDSSGYSVLGTGMSESSGIFTFPSTGYYLITFNSTYSGARDDGFITSRIDITTDNSSYSTVSETHTNNGAGSGTNAGAYGQCQFIFDVTDTSTHKCRFQFTSLNSGTEIYGSTSLNATNMVFIRLGDT